MVETLKRGWIWIAVSSEAQMTEDKISLEEQEEVCRAWCDRNKVSVVGVLKVPGLSRSESDVFDLFEEYASKGIYAYHELRKLWKARSFDYLVVYVLNRLGRSSSLYSYAMENTVRAGATVIGVTEGVRIDDSNVELMLPMGSFASTSEIKNLKLRRKMGMKSRAERGLKQSTWTPFGFTEERDDKGKVVKMVPDPAMRRALDDAAQLLLDGTPYLKMEIEAFERFGHGKDGKPYPPATFHYMFFSPSTWGHMAQNHRNTKTPGGQSFTSWAYRRIPAPEGVTVFRDTHQPLYSGDLAARMMAELDRRTVLRGGARPRTTPAFSSLFICDECSWYMVYHRNSQRSGKPGCAAYRCETIYHTDARADTPCRHQRYLKDSYIREHLERVIGEMLESNSLGDFDPRRNAQTYDRRPAIQTDIARVDQEMQRLVKSLRLMPSENPAWNVLNDVLTEQGEQRQRLERALRDAERESGSYDVRDQFSALEQIRAVGLDKLWGIPSYQVNQVLRTLMGNYRLSVKDGEFIHVVVAPLPNAMRANMRRAVSD